MARTKLTTNNKAVGLTLTASEWNEAVNAINSNIDGIESNSTALSTVQETADSALTLAKGAMVARSYDTYEAMIEALEAMSAGTLDVGQQILIVTMGVPDVWVSANSGSNDAYTYSTDEALITELTGENGLVGSWYTLRPLETQKVDLSDYYTKDTIDGKVSTLTAAAANAQTAADKGITAIRYGQNRLLLFGKDGGSAGVMEIEGGVPVVVQLSGEGSSLALASYFTSAASWAVSDSTIATVSSGVITAVAEGMTTLTEVDSDGTAHTMAVVVLNKEWIGSVDLREYLTTEDVSDTTEYDDLTAVLA